MMCGKVDAVWIKSFKPLCIPPVYLWLWGCTSGFSYFITSGISESLRTDCSQPAISSVFAWDKNCQVGYGGWCNVNSLSLKGEKTCGLCLYAWNSEFFFLFQWTKFYASKVNHLLGLLNSSNNNSHLSEWFLLTFIFSGFILCVHPHHGSHVEIMWQLAEVSSLLPCRLPGPHSGCWGW